MLASRTAPEPAADFDPFGNGASDRQNCKGKPREPWQIKQSDDGGVVAVAGTTCSGARPFFVLGKRALLTLLSTTKSATHKTHGRQKGPEEPMGC